MTYGEKRGNVGLTKFGEIEISKAGKRGISWSLRMNRGIEKDLLPRGTRGKAKESLNEYLVAPYSTMNTRFFANEGARATRAG
jgi:hypothetical protein